jgi:hypothetical protein
MVPCPTRAASVVRLPTLRPKVDSNSNVAKQHADVDGYQLAVYGAYKLDNNTSITYQGDIGNNQVSGDRRIAFMSSTANSDFSSWSAHVGAGVGKTMDLSERTTFTHRFASTTPACVPTAIQKKAQAR